MRQDHEVEEKGKQTIVFLHIPKTAGSTLKFVLANSFGLSHCNTMSAKPLAFDGRQFQFARKIFPALKSIGGHNIHIDTFSPRGKVFLTFVRDPVRRTISHFQHVSRLQFHEKNVDECLHEFKGWIRSKENANFQTRMVALDGDLERAKKILAERFTFVGLTEEFDVSLQIIRQVSPYRLDLNCRREQVSTNTELREILQDSHECQDLLRGANEKDLELYAFVKNELFPRYRHRFVVDPEVRFDTLSTKYPPKFLLSKWFNKYVYRSLTRLVMKR